MEIDTFLLNKHDGISQSYESPILINSISVGFRICRNFHGNLINSI